MDGAIAELMARGLNTRNSSNAVAKAASVSVTTTASITTSSVQIVPANLNRVGFVLWNNSSNSAYVTLGPTSVAATTSFIVPTFQSLVWVYAVAYTGALSAIRNAGSGTMTCYELIST